MSWENNVAAQKWLDANNIRFIGEVEMDGVSYSFNLMGVWQDQSDGALYVGQDSGCSCPSPWENHTTLGDLEQVKDLDHIIEKLNSAWGDASLNDKLDFIGYLRKELDPFVEMVRSSMNG